MERRFWLGIGILAVFLALGLWTAWEMENMHRPVSIKLEQASQAALDGRLEQGAFLARQAQEKWKTHRNLTATVADHAPMEEIDSLFAQLQTYAQKENAIEFAAYCNRIARLVEAIGEAQGLNWQNLL